MASPTNDYENQILVKRKSSARVLTLNRPKKLNALTPFYEYCSCNFLQNSLKTRNTKECRLLEFFQEDERNSDVKLILMKGNGKAFCAGGDVATVVLNARAGLCNARNSSGFIS